MKDFFKYRGMKIN